MVTFALARSAAMSSAVGTAALSMRSSSFLFLAAALAAAWPALSAASARFSATSFCSLQRAGRPE